MTVNPGWGGQPFIAHSLDKLARCARSSATPRPSRSTAASTPETAAPCRAAGPTCSSPARRSSAPPSPATPTARSRRRRGRSRRPGARWLRVSRPRHHGTGGPRRAAPVQQRQQRGQQRRPARVADLDARQLVAGRARRASRRRTGRRPTSQQVAAARARSRARAAWLSVPETRCRPIPSRSPRARPGRSRSADRRRGS